MRKSDPPPKKKHCAALRLDTRRLTSHLLYARRTLPFFRFLSICTTTPHATRRFPPPPLPLPLPVLSPLLLVIAHQSPSSAIPPSFSLSLPSLRTFAIVVHCVCVCVCVCARTKKILPGFLQTCGFHTKKKKNEMRKKKAAKAKTHTNSEKKTPKRRRKKKEQRFLLPLAPPPPPAHIPPALRSPPHRHTHHHQAAQGYNSQGGERTCPSTRFY